MLESEAMAILVGAGVSYGRREAALRAAGSALAILAEPGLYAAQLQEKGLALLRHALADEVRLLGGLAKKKMALVLREDAQYPAAASADRPPAAPALCLTVKQI